jgi:hypothetical protein
MYKILVILSFVLGSLLQAPTPQPPGGGIGQGPQPTAAQLTPTAAGCEVKVGCGPETTAPQPTDPLVFVGGGLAAALVAGGGVWLAASRRKNGSSSGDAPDKPE